MTEPGAERVALRFRDVDAFGHVYHAEYLTFLDELRTHWFGRVLCIDEPQSYVVARAEIDYLSPVTVEDQYVHADFELERAGTTSLTVRETLRAQDGRPVARTRVVVVLRDPTTGESRALTDREREACGPHVRPG